MPSKTCIAIGALSAAMAVALGAYHAHGLEKHLLERMSDATAVAQSMHNFDVGVRYQMFHALALVVVGLLFANFNPKLLTIAAALFVAGTLLFSGCLYVPVLTGTKLPWFLVPSGGLCLICGWIAVAAAPFLSRRKSSE
jgi:uncharacterized membrane protein YgdD (TMEM256/DUF423 family)